MVKPGMLQSMGLQRAGHTLATEQQCPCSQQQLSIAAKRWKQSNCPSTDEWINKLCSVCVYVYAIEYYCYKKDKIVTHGTTWMNPEGIMLSEISQTQKDEYCMFCLCEVLE